MAASNHQPRRTRKAEAARTEILRAAATMLRQKGYADMSLRDLASEVNMKAGSLYYHFPSKDALAVEVMRLGVEVVQDAVSLALEGHADGSPRERLVVALRVHLETLISEEDFSSAHIRCYPFAPPTIRSELAAVRKRYNAVWNGLVADYLGPEADIRDIRDMRNVFLGALNWSLEWFDPARDRIENYIAMLSRMLEEKSAK